MKLNILFFAALLRLTHAAGGDDDVCTEFLGSNLNYQDCKAALDLVPVTQHSDMLEFSLMRSKLFSAEPGSEPRFKLPQTFTSGQCIIEIAMRSGVDFAATTWDYQRAAVKRLLTYCVQPHGIGGRVIQRATIIEVRKKKNKLKPHPASVVSKCSVIEEGSALYKCLKNAEGAALAASRAYQDYSDRIDGLTYQINAALDTS